MIFLNRSVISILLVLACVVSPATAFAHHSFAATFTDNEITVEGVVDELKFSNPHVRVNFTVTDDAGVQTQWVAEGQAATTYRRFGWSKDSLAKGDTIRVSGNSTRNGSPMVSISNLDFIDLATNQVTGSLPTGASAYSEPVGYALPMQLADGRPNLSGDWVRIARGRPDDPSGAPLTAEAQALQDVFDPINDPQVQCEPPGLVRQAAATPHPVNIEQHDDHVVISYEEYGSVRTVYFDQNTMDPNAELSNLGQSWARYEDQKLIVESSHLLANLSGTNGNGLSDQTSTIETYYRNEDDDGKSSLSMDMEITDPGNLTAPWTLSWQKFYAEDYEFIEVDCQVPE